MMACFVSSRRPEHCLPWISHLVIKLQLGNEMGTTPKVESMSVGGVFVQSVSNPDVQTFPDLTGGNRPYGGDRGAGAA